MIIVNEEKRIAKSDKKTQEAAEKELKAFAAKIGAPAEAMEGDLLRVRPRRLLKVAVAEAMRQKLEPKKGKVGNPPRHKGVGG